MKYILMGFKQPFKGRVTAKDFRGCYLRYFLIRMSCVILDIFLGLEFKVSEYSLRTYGVFEIIWILLMAIPMWSMTMKRAHDIGWSGWFVWILEGIPVVGTIIFLVLLVKKSDMTNKYGPSPYLNEYVAQKELVQENNIVQAEKLCDVGEVDATIGTTSDIYDKTPVIELVKKHFCKYCGGEIDPISKKCSGCGKQYFKMPKIKLPKIGWRAAVCCGVLVVMMAAIYVLGINNYKMSQERDELVADLADIRAKLFQANTQVGELNRDLIGWKAEANRYKAAWETYKDKAEFMNDYVVIVSDDGTKLYHKYDCSRLDLSYFWVYNTEAAEVEGYSACPYCN